MKKAPAAPVKHPAKKSPPTRSAFLFLGFWPLLFACVIVTALVYAPSLENGWTNWDDNSYVIENELVRTTDLKTHFGTFQVMGNYHPLTMLTLAWDYASAGVEARGYHVTNLLLHLASTALLFVFLWQLFGSPFFRPSGNGDSQNKSANAAALAAAFGTLAFSIHPMHVESVAWISERKDVLYGFFYFATLVVWMRYRTGAQSPLLYATAIVLFACSLLSKGQAVTLPVVLVLVDWLQNRKWDAKAILEKVPFFLLALAFGVIAVLAQRESKAIQDIPDYTFLHRILFAGYALFTYVWKFFVPVKLSAFYPYPVKGTLPVQYFIGLAGSIGLVGTAIWLFRKSRWMWFGLLFFGAHIALLLQLLPVGSAVLAERYTYIAYTGLIVALCFVLVNGLPVSNGLAQMPRWASVGLGATLLIFFAVQTNARIKVWNNSETLWTNVLEQFDYAPNAHNNLGSFYQKQNNLDLALHHFNTAINNQPDFPEALINRSDIFRVRGELDKAIADCNNAIRVNPKYEGAYMNRGIARSIAGQYDSAFADFNKVIAMNPDNHKAYGNRGNLNDLRGDLQQALDDYNRALALAPDYETVYGNRAGTLLKLKRFNEALSDINIAIAATPQNPALYAIRADIYVGLNRYAEAFHDANTAQQLGKPVNPDFIRMLQQRVAAPPR